MKVNFKGLIYTLITLVVLFLIARFILSALPYIIVAGLIIWGILKIKGKSKKEEFKESIYENKTYTQESNTENEVEEDFDTSEAIDVDFEDVENK